MPKGDAKEGYLNTNAHLEAKVAMLMAQLAESQARELRMREALGDLRSGDGDPWCAEQQADSALALPFDDSALREMIEAAKAEEREACAKACEELEQHWSDYKDTALLNGDVDLSNAVSGEPRAARAIAVVIRARV